jgi:phospholipase/carboxylesterase
MPNTLVFASHVPDGARDGSPILILLHGRGSNEQDLLGLAPLLGPDAIIVTPRAPFPAGPWGYGPGWAWYRYLEEDRVDEDTLQASLESLDLFLGALDESLPFRPGKRILGGFSQGGTTSLAWGLTRPGGVAGVANFSGFLVSSPLVPVGHEASGDLPVFWGHGRLDPAIPFTLAARGRSRLEEAGFEVEKWDHPAGHQITRDEMESFFGWLDTIG